MDHLSKKCNTSILITNQILEQNFVPHYAEINVSERARSNKKAFLLFFV